MSTDNTNCDWAVTVMTLAPVNVTLCACTSSRLTAESAIFEPAKKDTEAAELNAKSDPLETESPEAAYTLRDPPVLMAMKLLAATTTEDASIDSVLTAESEKMLPLYSPRKDDETSDNVLEDDSVSVGLLSIMDSAEIEREFAEDKVVTLALYR